MLASLSALPVFAGQTDGLLAILVFQYSAREAGAGRTFWVKDRNGIEVPVIAARYSIWEHANNRERPGTPAEVAPRNPTDDRKNGGHATAALRLGNCPGLVLFQARARN